MADVEALEQFVSLIFGRPTADTQVATYRGHASANFKLTPSIFRKPATRENEHILLRELIAAHPDDFNADTSALELLV